MECDKWINEKRIWINWNILPEKIIEHWNTIHRKYPYQINKEWNEQSKKEYKTEIRSRKRNSSIFPGKRNRIIQIPQNLGDHYDASKGEIKTYGKGDLTIRYNEEELIHLQRHILEYIDNLEGTITMQQGEAMGWNG